MASTSIAVERTTTVDEKKIIPLVILFVIGNRRKIFSGKKSFERKVLRKINYSEKKFFGKIIIREIVCRGKIIGENVNRGGEGHTGKIVRENAQELAMLIRALLNENLSTLFHSFFFSS